MKIRELRMNRGLSQLKLAEVLGVSRSTIAMWETEASQPDNNALIDLADYFNTTVDFILGRENESALDNKVELDNLQFALYGEVKELSDEDKKKILDFAKFVKEQTKKK